MPIRSCQKDGEPGYKYGDEGTCYPYTPGDEKSRMKAKKKAEEQMRAIHAQGYNK